ncbi:MAG: ATP-dependent zinc metalloprotease FtsH [Lachnospiraceae bacterium]|nr:ATP-dependent zinc metalloprotease FtsH [Lachnospiraceae bacterium]
MSDNNSNRNNNGDGPKMPKNRQTIMILLVAALITLLFLSYLRGVVNTASNQKISYDEFIEMVMSGDVESVKISSDIITITPKVQANPYVTQTYYTVRVEDLTLPNRLLEAGVHFEQEETSSSDTIIYMIVSYILPIVLVWVLLSFLMNRMSKGGGIMGVGKSNAKVYVQKETGVTFKDVAGQEEAKESLQEVVDFLHNPGKYIEIGAKLPKGALLVGPPGTGKTLLAKAVAGEAHVPFFSLAGSDFVEMYVGVGASRVRDLFKDATKNAPCIIFIDEVDAIGKSRDSRYGGNDEREQTLNQLLSEMDGFDTSKGIFILAATNRPEILDKALLRPGRFDRRIIVDKPDLKGRIDTLKVHSRDVHLDDTVDLEEIGLATAGAVGSDLANMVNEAAINAVKHRRSAVNQKDLLEAIEVVMMGKEKKDHIMSKEERRIVSYHETGHALASALQKNTDPIQKITIVPRTMGALGYAWYVPDEEKHLRSQKELEERIITALAGRAAEEIVFNSVTTGASNDIEQATNLARAMVTQYGMSEKFGLIQLVTVEDQYLSGRQVLNCSDETAARVDEEVMRIIAYSYEEAKRLLNENRELMEELAQYLLEKESITGKEFMKIFREYRGEEPEDEENLENSENPETEKAPKLPETEGAVTEAEVSEPESGQAVSAEAESFMEAEVLETEPGQAVFSETGNDQADPVETENMPNFTLVETPEKREEAETPENREEATDPSGEKPTGQIDADGKETS